jgi:hypothetical protein
MFTEVTREAAVKATPTSRSAKANWWTSSRRRATADRHGGPQELPGARAEEPHASMGFTRSDFDKKDWDRGPAIKPVSLRNAP